MKRTILPICLTAAFVLCMFFCNSCEKYVLPELTLDQDTIIVPVAGGVYPISFTTNVKWDIDDFGMVRWLNFSEITGSSDCQLKKYVIDMTVDPNDTGAPRSFEVPITTMSLEKHLFVQQEGGLAEYPSPHIEDE
ncbi:MAG: BACON domain-containing protein [Bacteroidales bacterium]|nr:BACON domain-containing protein [Candidatus Equibacterium intestinale]